MRRVHAQDEEERHAVGRGLLHEAQSLRGIEVGDVVGRVLAVADRFSVLVDLVAVGVLARSEPAQPVVPARRDIAARRRLGIVVQVLADEGFTVVTLALSDRRWRA
jgi:hypothetical protein